MTQRLLLLELNELNFELVARYVEQGRLPAFKALMAKHGYQRTSSEEHDHELEPWIQWVTAHTGKSFAEHGVFRLGDFVHRPTDQIWEMLERSGVKVGALSPMNAANQTERAGFFIPDPWTRTRADGPFLARKLYGAICQVVNENAQARITPGSLVWLLLGAMRYASPRNYPLYLKLVASARSKPWTRAIFLDVLLADVFNALVRATKVQFASLFVNAAAHIQHHYLYSSSVSTSPFKNPSWYCAEGQDPLLDVYEAYDRILGQVQDAFPDARLMVATGLHQEPYSEVLYYWRLKNHAGFLNKIGIEFGGVTPLMSRDFVVEFNAAEDASAAQAKLERVRDLDGMPLFDVDNRGSSLFVTLVYGQDIPDDFKFLADNELHAGLRQDVAFVAIKNGGHDGAGYFLDTGQTAADEDYEFPLKALPARIRQALGVPQPA